MAPAALGESGLVSERMQPLGKARRLRPCRALRRRRQVDRPFLGIGDSHGESNPLSVGRPAQIAGLFGKPGKLGRRTLNPELQGKDLRAFWLAWGEQCNAFTVSGPDCAAALGEKSM